ncbi:class I SAM-dependent methyltransferase [Maricurvus nonylphenolicus]|uniref:class I SAM-dependent methyltransferase n=1 Tax=Maricurvus nonylphenolicus TaxID=1008307 RepID=UPI0036F27BE8
MNLNQILGGCLQGGQKLSRGLKAAALLTVVSASQLVSATPVVTEELQKAVDNPERTAAFKARDSYRHPAETLAFFDVQSDMTVVEIWPGGGWYTEILGPYLNRQGKFYAAHFPANSQVAFFTRMRKSFEEKLSANPKHYNRVEISSFHPPSNAVSAPAGEVDRVLTFRNVHNWMKAGYGEQAFTEFFKVLKPGGVLGVVEHRAKPGTAEAAMIRSGYVTEAYVIEQAQKAGFVLEAKSEVNANPNDSTIHPKGVWTLPPSLRLGDEDKEKYLAIGESDRMTLKFRKPLK